MQDAGCKTQDAGHRMQDAGCRMQDAGCKTQDTGTDPFLLPASCFLLLASCLLLPASCLLLPASCLLPLASCFLPLASCFLLLAPCPLTGGVVWSLGVWPRCWSCCCWSSRHAAPRGCPPSVLWRRRHPRSPRPRPRRHLCWSIRPHRATSSFAGPPSASPSATRWTFRASCGPSPWSRRSPWNSTGRRTVPCSCVPPFLSPPASPTSSPSPPPPPTGEASPWLRSTGGPTICAPWLPSSDRAGN